MNYILHLFAKIKNICAVSFYCKRVDYSKMSMFNKIFAYFFTILYFVIYYSVLFVPPILLLIFNSQINDFFDKILPNELDGIALTLYGLQLTIFSVLIALKHKKIYGESEFKIGLKINKIGLNIDYFILMANIYIVFFVIRTVLGVDNRGSSFFIIVYSTILLIKYSSLIKKSTAYVYYRYKCDNIKTNVLFRKKGNVLSVIKDEENIEYYREMLNKSIDKELLKIISYFRKFKKNIFYKIENDIDDEIELFEIYLSNYFKSIKNDAQIFGLYHTFSIIMDTLAVLLKNKKYLELDKILILLLQKYDNLLKSHHLKRRFKYLNRDLKKFENNRMILNIYVRNLYLLLILKSNVDLIKIFIDKKGNSLEKKLFDDSFKEIKNKILTVQKTLKNYEEINKSLFNFVKESIDIQKVISTAIKEINHDEKEIKE